MLFPETGGLGSASPNHMDKNRKIGVVFPKEWEMYARPSKNIGCIS